MKYLGKKLSTIFRLHEVLGENKIIHYIPITWSTWGIKNYPLDSDYMEYLGGKKIFHYIPITSSTWDKNYPLYSDYMKYLG